MTVDSTNPEVAIEVFPYLREYKDGTVERLAGTQVVPAGVDPQTQVESKDIIIIPETSVSARLYRPTQIPKLLNQEKLPLVIYYHGGAFCISSTSDPVYHNSLNLLVAESKIILVSVNYRLAPENPLPIAYEDSWAALTWLVNSSHNEPWVRDFVDFDRLFLAGDSAGANISHHLALRIKNSDLTRKFKITGVALIHPYFWGEEPIGVEITDLERKSMVDQWWRYVCPSDKGNDDLWINPFAEGSESVENLGCEKVIVVVAERDILRERGREYYEKLVQSEWKGQAELVDVEGEDHDFHIFNPTTEKAKGLVKRLGLFFNQ